jgi:hypothetical protein
MLLFQWNALRVGDHVTVHDDHNLSGPMHAGSVRIVQTAPGTSGNDVAIRLDEGRLVRPRRGAVHTTSTGSRDCWRCHMSAAHLAAHDRSRLGVPDRAALAD